MKLVVKINKKKYQIVHSRNFSFLGSGASSVRGAHVAKGSTGAYEGLIPPDKILASLAK